jgi:hypothetical protein
MLWKKRVTGVYAVINKLNDKTYINRTVNLYNRLYHQFAYLFPIYTLSGLDLSKALVLSLSYSYVQHLSK